MKMIPYNVNEIDKTYVLGRNQKLFKSLLMATLFA